MYCKHAYPETGMSDWRELVRIAIIETIKNESWIQFENTKNTIEQHLNITSIHVPNFKEDSRINIELVVPIQIPYNGKKGDCKRVVETVRDHLIKLGGGTQIFHASGSWVSSVDGLNVDQCLIVYTAIPANSWHESIPVLRDLIKYEIQSKLLQQCVFIRIDCMTHGPPINLLQGSKLDEVMFAADKFLEVDTSCFELIPGKINETEGKVTKNNSIKIVNNNHSIQGNNNLQINSKGNVVTNIGSGAIAAGRDINFYNDNQNSLPVNELTEFMTQVADKLAEEKTRVKLLEKELANTKKNDMYEFAKLALSKTLTDIRMQENIIIESTNSSVNTGHDNLTHPHNPDTFNKTGKTSEEILNNIMLRILPDFEKDVINLNLDDIPQEDDGSEVSKRLTEFLELGLREIREIRKIVSDYSEIYYLDEENMIPGFSYNQQFLKFQYQSDKTRHFLFFIEHKYGTRTSFDEDPIDKRRIRKDCLEWIDDQILYGKEWQTTGDRFSCVSFPPIVCLDAVQRGIRVVAFGAEIKKN